jgi:mannose-1-phosphate guanylyltransferase/mannose-6-phosphate isomerase
VPPPGGLVCVILAGGSGTRLWPLSRKGRPKHLLPLAPDGRSLLRHAFERAGQLGGEVLVVTAKAQLAQVEAELPDLSPGHLLLEPEPRGTGPALAWAALEALRLAPDPVMISLHADHYIPSQEEVTRVLLSAAWWARQADLLVSVGLVPSFPATGFGYLEAAEELPRPHLPEQVLPLRRALGFVEKPSRQRAEEMLAQGDFLWNTGLFSWPAQLLLSEMERLAPEVLTAVRAAVEVEEKGGGGFAAAWGQVPQGVVERLVLERSDRLGVLATELPWSDLGSYADLQQVAASAGGADRDGNVVRGEVLLPSSQGCFVDSASGRMVVVVGASGLVVVDTEDAVLVCPLDKVQELTSVVAQLHDAGRDDLL